MGHGCWQPTQTRAVRQAPVIHSCELVEHGLRCVWFPWCMQEASHLCEGVKAFTNKGDDARSPANRVTPTENKLSRFCTTGNGCYISFNWFMWGEKWKLTCYEACPADQLAWWTEGLKVGFPFSKEATSSLQVSNHSSFLETHPQGHNELVYIYIYFCVCLFVCFPHVFTSGMTAATFKPAHACCVWI